MKVSTKLRRVVVAVVAPLVSGLLFLSTGEIVLRVVYRDAGRATLGGPGGRDFEHLFIRDEQRGRLDLGPRRHGVPRVLVFGDSISWGQGVRDWRQVWTEQVAEALERTRGPHEMAVLAQPGRGIADHAAEIAHWGARIRPDLVIYQWYVNDLEVSEHRPGNQRSWQQWSLHRRLRSSSYLYYFIDNRLSTLLPSPDRSYVDYILQDFKPGTLEWSEFERLFHNFATHAREVARKRLLVLYPQVPFRGAYPLLEVHQRMHALAGPHTLVIPPAAWLRVGGTIEQRRDTASGQAVRVAAGIAGPVIETRDYYLGDRPTVEVELLIACDATGAQGPIGTLEMIDVTTGQPVARGEINVDSTMAGWQRPRVRLDIQAGRGHNLRVRWNSSGAVEAALASIELPVDYGMTVVDLTQALNTFNTHASIFDAHPNARAHAVVAQEILAALSTTGGSH